MLVLPEALKVWHCDGNVLFDRERGHLALLLMLLPIGLLAVGGAVTDLLAPLAFDAGRRLAYHAFARRLLVVFPQLTTHGLLGPSIT